MHVIGTAGHVDHGKSTLTRALTGINPDRLAEEQRREMTIDLGFAWLTLPNGESVGIVDVPGHRDFIENMLAGVGGIDAVMLVIAADEGIMPQTREHLAILDLLAVPAGLIALTKTDLVTDSDWLDLVQLDIIEAVQGTGLDSAPIIPVSAHTGSGLPELVAALQDVLTRHPARPDIGNPRLSIDRVFTMSGFGVVVTGTLRDGSLTVGQEVELQPANQRARIRGLQSHEQTLETVGPGRRVAVNLRGVERDQIARGHMLGLPGAWHPTMLVDAWLRYLPGTHLPLEHNAEIKLFVGAAEVVGTARVLDRERVLPGETAWVQFRLNQPLVATAGDRFIIRRPSPPETLGGGIILHTAPGRRWKRFRPEVSARFEALLSGDPVNVALIELAGERGPVHVNALSLGERTLADVLASGQVRRLTDGWVIHQASWALMVERARRALAEFHRAEPLRTGAPPEVLRNRLRLDGDAFGAALGAMAEEGLIVIEPNNTLRLPEHAVRHSAAQQAALDRLWQEFGRAPYQPPTFAQACELVGDDLVRSLIERGSLVRISEDVILTPEVLREWIAFAQNTLARGESLTVAALRDHFGTTRRYALDYLERLDAMGITRRVGDDRVLASGKWERLLPPSQGKRIKPE